MASSGDDGYGEDLPQGTARRVAVLVVLTIFLSAVFGTAAVDTFDPAPPIELVGSEKAIQERLDRQAGVWDGSLARRFEHHHRERSRVRSMVLPQYSFLQFAFLGEAPAQFVVGDDHWLYLRKRIELESLPDATLAGAFVNSVVALDRRLAGNGIEFLFVPIPRKSYVVREPLPNGIEAHHAVDDLVIDGLLERRVETVDLRDDYRTDDPQEIYFKLDTHWTPNAARIAAREIAAAVNGLAPESGRLGRLQIKRPSEHPPMGLMSLRSLDVDPTVVDLDVLDLRIPEPSWLHVPPKTRQFLKQSSPSTRTALAGTSFSHNQQLATLVSHYLGELVYNGAEPALSYMAAVHLALSDYLAADSPSPLERMIWENPVSLAYELFHAGGARFTADVGETFDVLPPRASLPFLALHPTWSRLPLGETVDLAPQRAIPLMVVPGGVLAHGGDGVVGLRLRGEVTGAAVGFELYCGGDSYRYEAEPGPLDVLLPVLASRACAEPMRLVRLPGPAASLRIDAIAFEHEPVRTAPAAFSGTLPLGAQRAAGIVTLTTREPVTLERRAALLVKSSGEAGTRAPVRLRVVTGPDGSAREFAFDSLLAGGALAVDIGSDAGRELQRVELLVPDGRLDVMSAYVTGVRATR